MTKYVLPAGFIIALSIGVGCEKSAPAPPKAHGGPEIGFQAPEIVGIDLDGIEFSLSDYRGQVVMLDFFGDW